MFLGYPIAYSTLTWCMCFQNKYFSSFFYCDLWFRRYFCEHIFL